MVSQALRDFWDTGTRKVTQGALGMHLGDRTIIEDKGAFMRTLFQTHDGTVPT